MEFAYNTHGIDQVNATRTLVAVLMSFTGTQYNNIPPGLIRDSLSLSHISQTIKHMMH